MPKKLLGLRISEEVLSQLDRIAFEKHQTINQVAKNAIIEWLDMIFVGRRMGMVIISKPFLGFLLEFIDSEEKIIPFIKTISDHAINYYEIIIGKKLNKNTLDDYIKNTPKILGPLGLMWFDHIDIIKTQNMVSFNGIHSLGEMWSKLYILTSNHLMKSNFKLSLDEHSVNFSKTRIFLSYSLE